MKITSSLSPFVPENLVSEDGFGSPVPRQPAHLYTQAESGADPPGKVANPARGQLNRGKYVFLVPVRA